MSVADTTASNSNSTAAPAAAPAAKAAGAGGGASKGGLEGVVAARSEICFIDGEAGRLVYRGYDIEDLVENVTFEETAYLLWEGELPTRQELTQVRQQLASSMALPAHAMAILKSFPAQTQPMDALRTVVSALAATDPDVASN